jgi:DNA polymerase III epsilon subunit-like protein
MPITPISKKPQKDLSMPKFHRRVMVFDTETSGLMPKHKFGTPFPPMEEYPHIMQFSWIVYNVSANLIEEVVDEYVQIPDTAPINPESMKVHGITREIAKEKGKPIAPLLVKFYTSYMKCDCIVAHNLRFDSEMVRKEMWRNRKDLEKIVYKDRANLMCGVFTLKFNAAYYIDTFCTMMNTIQFCGIDFAVKSKDFAVNNPVLTNAESLGEVIDSSLNPILGL